MSNRSDLIAHRTTLIDIDEPLLEIERAAASRDAASHIGRARAMIRAAECLLSVALRDPIDGMADPIDRPAGITAS